MADGELCIHCGWQETDHEFKHEQERPGRRLPGYKKTLLRCRQFEAPPHEETAEERAEKEFQLRCLERQARGAAAWGAYCAQGRQQNFNRELAERERAISHSYGEERRRLIEEKEQWVQRCKNGNTLHIGPF